MFTLKVSSTEFKRTCFNVRKLRIVAALIFMEATCLLRECDNFREQRFLKENLESALVHEHGQQTILCREETIIHLQNILSTNCVSFFQD